MLRQQLQETKETLAARDAEVNELKTRVAELEKLQEQQQQLITMKDSALAAAQQKLGKTGKGPGGGRRSGRRAAPPRDTAGPGPAARRWNAVALGGGVLLLTAWPDGC